MTGVSVVVPVYNSLAVLVPLLDSLIAYRNRTRIEVIFVDNASTDGSRFLVHGFARRHPEFDVRVVENSVNVNFAGAVNQGFALSKYPLVLSLNADAEALHDGWLDTMVRTIESDQRIACVGAKLVYESGELQHAGMVFSRGLPRHADRMAPANEPRANERRDVACLSAACLLISKAAIERAGGLDEGFKNGYEDVDFSLRLAAMGYRLVYEPGAMLIHREVTSPGRHAFEGTNLALLAAKWGGVAGLSTRSDAGIYYGAAENRPVCEVYGPPAHEARGRILCLMGADDRWAHYRLRVPYGELAKRGWSVLLTPFIDQSQLASADIVVLHRSAGGQYEAVQAAVAASGKRTIYELDELAVQAGANDAALTAAIERLVRRADAVTVSNRTLQRMTQALNADVVVVPDAFDAASIDSVELAPTALPVRVAIISAAHEREESQALVDALAPLLESDARLTFVCIGADLRSRLLGLPPNRLEWYGSTDEHEQPVPDLYRLLARLRLDIGLVPAPAGLWAHARGETRALEFAGSGILPIVGDGAVLGEMAASSGLGFVARSPGEWASHLRSLAADAGHLSAARAAAREEVRSSRSPRAAADEVERLCERLLAAPAAVAEEGR